MLIQHYVYGMSDEMNLMKMFFFNVSVYGRLFNMSKSVNLSKQNIGSISFLSKQNQKTKQNINLVICWCKWVMNVNNETEKRTHLKRKRKLIKWNYNYANRTIMATLIGIKCHIWAMNNWEWNVPRCNIITCRNHQGNW